MSDRDHAIAVMHAVSGPAEARKADIAYIEEVLSHFCCMTCRHAMECTRCERPDDVCSEFELPQERIDAIRRGDHLLQEEEEKLAA